MAVYITNRCRTPMSQHQFGDRRVELLTPSADADAGTRFVGHDVIAVQGMKQDFQQVVEAMMWPCLSG